MDHGPIRQAADLAIVHHQRDLVLSLAVGGEEGVGGLSIIEAGVLVVREESGILMGRVILERRPSNAGVVVCVEARCARGAEDGTFVLSDVPPGPQTVAVSRGSYLRSWREVGVPDGLLVLPDVTLLGGDVNGDDHIDEFDAISTGLAWNTTPTDLQWDGRADITDDGTVNILDMVAIQFNWDQVAPGPWDEIRARGLPALPGRQPAAKDLATPLVVSAARAAVSRAGEPFDLQIRVQEARDVYGGRLRITFDPAVIQVRDAEQAGRTPGQGGPGGQVRPGDFLDREQQLVLVNAVDNSKGTIDFAVTQLRPAGARSGSGVLATVPFVAVGQGSTMVRLSEVRLGDGSRPDPLEVPAQVRDGRVTVGPLRTIYLPVAQVR